MTQKERKREEQELADAVRTLRAAIPGIAHRKARHYEPEFLLCIRDMIDREISFLAEVEEISADYVAREVKNAITKPNNK